MTHFVISLATKNNIEELRNLTKIAPQTIELLYHYNAEIIINDTSAQKEIIYESFYPCLDSLNYIRVLVIQNDIVSADNLRKRYSVMKRFVSPVEFEDLESEQEDYYSDDSLFNISSWGADLSFREIISMYEENELAKPELQRKYVWDKFEASRFIESLLMGLPVPSIFLAQAGTRKLIVDGYQRIMTVYDYVRGIFSTDGKIFRLSNSDRINVRWRNKAFSELSLDDQRKIRSTTIHAIIFEQKKPENNDTSLYQVFERINTSGRTLTPQEIRNCVYQGSFNKLLFELNELAVWRTLFGSVNQDSRMRDIECILRFFVMKSNDMLNSDINQISLKKTLNDFMGKYKDASNQRINQFRKDFISTMEEVSNKLGKYAFRNYTKGKFTTKFHPAIFDAVSVAFYLQISSNQEIDEISIDKHIELLKNEEFRKATSVRTTNTENIEKRIRLVQNMILRPQNER